LPANSLKSVSQAKIFKKIFIIKIIRKINIKKVNCRFLLTNVAKMMLEILVEK